MTKDGRVKILDFGLAKLTRQNRTAERDRDLPTETRGTEPGVVLGTLGYMSPEQVRGQARRRALATSSPSARSSTRCSRESARSTATPPQTRCRPSSGRSAGSLGHQPAHQPRPRAHRPPLPREEPRASGFSPRSDIAFDLEMLSGSSGAVPASAGAARRSGRLLWPAIALLALLLGPRSRNPLDVAFARTCAAEVPATDLPPRSDRQRAIRPDGQTVVFSASWDGGPMRLYTLRPGSPEWSAPASPVSVSRRLAPRRARGGGSRR